MSNLTTVQINKGKALLKQSLKSESLVATDRFALGRWAVEVCGPAVEGRPEKTAAAAAVSVEDAADAIGFASQTLNEYRRVATQWGDSPTHNLSWSALRFLVSECKTAEAREGLILKAQRDNNVEIPTVNQLRLAAGKNPEQNGRDAIEQAAREAAEIAKAESDAKHAKELADALAAQERKQKAEEQKNLKAEADRIRKEEQAKAAEATRKQREADAKRIAELEKSLSDAAKKAEFDLSTLSEAQKAQVMTMLANDPEKAAEYFKAANAERDRKNREAAEKAAADEQKRQQNAEIKRQREIAILKSKEYAESPLNMLDKKVMPLVFEFRNLLQAKGITQSDLNNGGWESLDPIYNMAYALEAIAASIREQADMLNVERQLSDVSE